MLGRNTRILSVRCHSTAWLQLAIGHGSDAGEGGTKAAHSRNLKGLLDGVFNLLTVNGDLSVSWLGLCLCLHHASVAGS